MTMIKHIIKCCSRLFTNGGSQKGSSSLNCLELWSLRLLSTGVPFGMLDSIHMILHSIFNHFIIITLSFDGLILQVFHTLQATNSYGGW